MKSGKTSLIKKIEEFDQTPVRSLFSHEQIQSSTRVLNFAAGVFNLFQSSHWRGKVEGIKNYTMYNADHKISYHLTKSLKWKSAVKTPLTQVLTDALSNKVRGLNFSIDYTVPVSSERSKEKNGGFLDWIDKSSNLKNESILSADDATETGEGFWFCRLDYSNYLLEYNRMLANQESGGKEESIKVESTLCRTEYVPRSHVIYEANKNYNTSRFYGIIFKKTRSEFMRMFGHHIDLEMHPDIDQLQSFLKGETSRVMKLDYIYAKRLKDYESALLQTAMNDIDPTTSARHMQMGLGYGQTDPMREIDVYNMSYYNNEFEIYLHLEEETMTIMVNGHTIIDIPNPYRGVNPLIRIAKKAQGGTGPCDGTTQSLAIIQKMYDNVFNTFNDALRIALNPMFTSQGAINFPGMEDGVMVWEDRKVIQVNGDGVLKPFDLVIPNDLVARSQQFLEYLRSLGALIVNLNRYTGPSQGGGIERVTDGVNSQIQISQDVMRGISASMAEGYKNTIKCFLFLIKTQLPKSLSLQFELNGSVENISVSDIISNTNISYNVDNMVDVARMTEINDIMKLIDLVGRLPQDPGFPVQRVDVDELVRHIGELLGQSGLLMSDKKILAKKRNSEKLAAKFNPAPDIAQEVPLENTIDI